MQTASTTGADGFSAESARQPSSAAAGSSTRSSGGLAQALCAAASRLPSAAAATVGIHPDAIDASPLQTTSAVPSSAIVPHAWPRPERAANHSVRSSRHARQLTSSCGASTAAWPPPVGHDRGLARQDAPVRAEALDEGDARAVGRDGRIGDLHRRAVQRRNLAAREVDQDEAGLVPAALGRIVARDRGDTSPPLQSNSQMFRPSGPAGRVSPVATSIM